MNLYIFDDAYTTTTSYKDGVDDCIRLNVVMTFVSKAQREDEYQVLEIKLQNLYRHAATFHSHSITYIYIYIYIYIKRFMRELYLFKRIRE